MINKNIPPGKVVALDTETTGLNIYHGDKPFAIALRDEDSRRGYFEFEVDPFSREVLVGNRERRRLRDWLRDDSITRVFHNAAFDLAMLKIGLDITVHGRVEDTWLAAHVCYSAEDGYSLKELAKRYLRIGTDDEQELKDAVKRCRKTAKSKGWAIGPRVETDYWLPRHLDPANRLCRRYALKDVKRTMLLWQMYDHVPFAEDPSLREAYEVELRLSTLLMRIERRGIALDPAINEEELRKADRLLARCERSLKKMAGNPEFNPRSSVQVGKQLFDVRGLEPKHRTPTGKPKVSQDVLLEYRDDAFARDLLAYRSAAKAKSAYFEAFRRSAVPDPLVDDGFVIHPHYRQAGIRTGRLSCSNPNLQGIADDQSSRSDTPISARRPFGPRPGYRWYVCDYSQLEARIFAAVAGIDVVIAAFNEGRDLHTETANRAWGGRDNPRAIQAAMSALGTANAAKARKWLAKFNFDIVAAEESRGKKNSRSRGKTIFFARMFGAGPNSIKDNLRVPVEEAREFIVDFDKAVPGLTKFVRKMSTIGQNQGHVETLYGRKLHLDPDFTYRAASYLVQGTAADLIKRRMLVCNMYFRRNKIDGHIVLQIHDELIFEIRKEQATKKVIRDLKRKMEDHEGVVPIDLPVQVQRVKRCWSEKESIRWLDALSRRKVKLRMRTVSR
jgi:DNA polymerase-1